jgi:hypothetical protein
MTSVLWALFGVGFGVVLFCFVFWAIDRYARATSFRRYRSRAVPRRIEPSDRDEPCRCLNTRPPFYADGTCGNCNPKPGVTGTDEKLYR